MSRLRLRIKARGHAAENFLGLFVIAQAVISRYVCLAAAKPVTAAMIAAGPCDACVIVNVSGCCAIHR